MAVDGSIRIDTKIDESSLKGSLNKMEGSLNSFAEKATAILAGISIGAFIKASVQSQAQIELATAKMETLLGSTIEAQKMIAEIQKMADVTPYESKDLIEAATTMKGFGIAAADLLPLLEAIGNAGGGVAENMKGIARVLGQVRAQNRLLGNDMYQFINAGVPILEVLSEKLHKSTGDIKQMAEEGKIGYKEVHDALMELYTGQGKYSMLMAKAAQTLPGMYSTMTDAAMSFGRTLVQMFEGRLKGALETITKIFKKLTDFINSMTPQTKDFVITLVEMVSVFTAVAVVVNVAKKAFDLLNIAMRANPILALVSMLAILATELPGIIKNWEEWSAAQVRTAGTLGQVIGMLDALRSSWDTFKNEGFGEGIAKMAFEANRKTFEEAAKKAGKQLKDVVPDFMKKFVQEDSALKRGVDIKTNLKPPVIPSNFASSASKEAEKYLEQQKKLYDETNQWLLTNNMKRVDAELTQLAYEYQKKLEMAQGNNALLLMLQEQYQKERERIIRNAKQEEASQYIQRGPFFNFLGIMFGVNLDKLDLSLEAFHKGLFGTMAQWGLDAFGFRKAADFVGGFAKGIDAGTFIATSAIKGLAFMVFTAFDTVWGLLTTGFDILSWMSDFSPSDILDAFKGFLDGLTNFFNQDIGSLPIFFDSGVQMMQDFLDGMIQNLPAIADSLGNMIDHITDVIIDKGPEFVNKFLDIFLTLFDKLIEKMPEIVDAIMAVIQEILKRLPEIVDKLLKALVTLLQSLGDHADEFASAIVKAIAGILESIGDNLPALLTAVVKIVIGLINGIISALPTLARSFDKLMIGFVNAIVAAFPVLVSGIIRAIPALITAIIESVMQSLDNHTGEKMIYALVVGIIKAIPSIVKSIFLAIWDIFTKSLPAFFKGLYTVGKNVVLGIVRGITEYGPRLWEGIKNVFTSFVDKIKSFFGIHSPSTLFAGFGGDIMRGLLNGIMSFGSTLFDAFSNIFTSIFSFLGTFISKFADIGKSFGSALADGFKTIGTTIVSAIKSVLQKAVDALVNTMKDKIMSWIKDAINSLIPGGGGGGGGGIDDGLPGGGLTPWARGTMDAPGGLSIVGERGPEIIELPAHSRVFNAADTKKMLSGAGQASIMAGLARASNLQPGLTPGMSGAQTIILQNEMTIPVVVDGKEIGRAAFKYIDKNVRLAYGS